MSYAANFGVTLTQHVLHRQALHPNARGQFSQLITQIGVAAKLISAQVRRAGLIEIWGATGDENVQGEEVQKLDRIANDTLKEVLIQSGCVSALASEEEDEFISVPSALLGDYVVAFDPLDGSSNIDSSVSIGTIFAIYHRRSIRESSVNDVLRPGYEQVGAGYVMYGSSTVMVYTAGRTVDCFTLDPSCGEFFLTRSDLKYSEKTHVLSINECNIPYWPTWVKPFVKEIIDRNDEAHREITGRHIGSLVADFHRNLIKGGLYLYPEDRRTGRGKLRLLYECNPLAFIAEVAGGAASTGRGRILEVMPEDLHQRVGLIIGPKADVALAEAFAREAAKAEA
ncbi:class 1 fructose-bisphosphatase [Myxococcota bacterium]|nr:class 1 fructose-bisphosphatase [Myxococcota bacterium]MBU1900204.1 class 1 fructose-bisphosphatase [Myxococcota bacterium]